MKLAVPKHLIVPLLCLAGAAQASETWRPYHSGVGGAAARVAYVHLVMEQTPEHREADRRWLEEQHEICRQGKEGVELIGKAAEPYRALPPEGVPERPWIEDIEIYYAAGRSVTVVTTTTYSIDLARPTARHPDRKGDCALARTTARTIHYLDGASECKVRQTAGRRELGLSCKQVPGRARANVAAPGIVHARPLPQAPQRAGGAFLPGLPEAALPMLVGTGETRLIAGRRCRVFGTPDLLEQCVETQEDPAVLQVSPFNRVSGLLLQAVMSNRRYTARRAEAGIEVGEHLFRIPDKGGQPAGQLPPLPAKHR